MIFSFIKSVSFDFCLKKHHFPSSKITSASMSKRTQSQPIPFLSKKPRNIPSDENPLKKPQIPTHPLKPLTSSDEISIAINHLRQSDPTLINLLDSNEPPKFNFNPPFLALTKSILYQQLATKAADSIYNRFATLCGGEAMILPDTVLALTAQQLRVIGVSGRKASYLHDLATKYVDGVLSDSLILEMNDEDLMTRLIEVKGIGVWSVHMFMIFNLHRADVLPVGDLGVRKGVQKLYGLKELPKAMEMEELCEKWKPYRSVGAWYMWRLMEAAKGKGKGKGSGVIEKEDADSLLKD